MENRKKYRLWEMEEIISGMEFEKRCDEIVEIDDDLQLIISGWYVAVPGLSLILRAGVACVFDKETGMFMPDFDVTVLYEDEPIDFLYYKQDGFTGTLADWLKGRLSVSDMETLVCYLVIPDTED